MFKDYWKEIAIPLLIGVIGLEGAVDQDWSIIIMSMVTLALYHFSLESRLNEEKALLNILMLYSDKIKELRENSNDCECCDSRGCEQNESK